MEYITLSGEMHGIVTAPPNVPQVRKKLPAPFTRARIDLDGGTRAKRSWKDTPVTQIAKGDTVAGVGVVAASVESIQIPQAGEQMPTLPWMVQLHNVLGEYFVFSGHQRVFAFTVDEQPG